MLFSINDYHGVPNCSSKLGRVGSLNRHVCDEVGYHTHLNLLGSSTHLRHPRISGIGALWIKPLQTLECRRRLDLPLIVGNYKDRVAVEVGAGQTLGHLAV